MHGEQIFLFILWQKSYFGSAAWFSQQTYANRLPKGF